MNLLRKRILTNHQYDTIDRMEDKLE